MKHLARVGVGTPMNRIRFPLADATPHLYACRLARPMVNRTKADLPLAESVISTKDFHHRAARP